MGRIREINIVVSLCQRDRCLDPCGHAMQLFDWARSGDMRISFREGPRAHDQEILHKVMRISPRITIQTDYMNAKNQN
jgi:hypothetical protein